MAALAAKSDVERDTKKKREQWPFNVFFAVCLWSDATTVCRMRRVCTNFQALSEHMPLWLSLIQRDYPHYNLVSTTFVDDSEDPESHRHMNEGAAAAAAAASSSSSSSRARPTLHKPRPTQEQQQPVNGYLGAGATLEDRARFLFDLGDIFFCPGRACYSFVALSANFPATFSDIIARSKVSRAVGRELCASSAKAAASAKPQPNNNKKSNSNVNKKQTATNVDEEDAKRPFYCRTRAGVTQSRIQQELARIEQSLRHVGDPFLEIEASENNNNNGDNSDEGGFTRRKLIRLYTGFHIQSLRPMPQSDDTKAALGEFGAVHPYVQGTMNAINSRSQQLPQTPSRRRASSRTSQKHFNGVKISAPRESLVPALLFSDILFLFARWQPEIYGSNFFSLKEEDDDAEDSKKEKKSDGGSVVELFAQFKTVGQRTMTNESKACEKEVLGHCNNLLLHVAAELLATGMFFACIVLPYMVLLMLTWWVFDAEWFFLRWPMYLGEMLLAPLMQTYVWRIDGAVGQAPALDPPFGWIMSKWSAAPLTNATDGSSSNILESSSSSFFSAESQIAIIFSAAAVVTFVLTMQQRRCEKRVWWLPRLDDRSTTLAFSIVTITWPLLAIGLLHYFFCGTAHLLTSLYDCVFMPYRLQRSLFDFFFWIAAPVVRVSFGSHDVNFIAKRFYEMRRDIGTEFDSLMNVSNSNSSSGSDANLTASMPFYNIFTTSAATEAHLWTTWPIFVLLLLGLLAFLRVVAQLDVIDSGSATCRYRARRRSASNNGSDNQNYGYPSGHHLAAGAVTGDWRRLVTAATVAYKNIFIKKAAPSSSSSSSSSSLPVVARDSQQKKGGGTRSRFERLSAQKEDQLRGRWINLHCAKLATMAGCQLLLFFLNFSIFVLPALQIVCWVASSLATAVQMKRFFAEAKNKRTWMK